MSLRAKGWLAAAMLTCMTAVQAAESAAPAAPKGDAEAGKAAAAVCAACHGADGNSAAAAFPKIAGQGERYIVKQLKDIKSGARAVPTMTGFVANMDEQTMWDLAAYFSSQTIQPGAADPELVEAGQALWRGGNVEKGITACSACHGSAGKGVPGAAFPALAGQHAGYIEAQLKAFRAAGRQDANATYRENDGETMMMRSTAAKLTDSDIEAISSYINGLY